MKLNKTTCIIYADLIALIKKQITVKIIPGKYLTTKIGEYIPCGNPMSAIWTFDNIKIKHSLYRGGGCMNKFCISLREHAVNVINFEKKRMLPLTEEKIKLHRDLTVCYICRKSFTLKLTRDKTYSKVRENCHFSGNYRGAVHSICNLSFNVLNEIPLVFQDGLNYDYHFAIKELANEFKGQIECFGENTENYKKLYFPIEK